MLSQAIKSLKFRPSFNTHLIINYYSTSLPNETSMVGSVKPYQRHLLIHTHESNWPKRAFETNELTKQIFRKLSFHPSQLLRNNKLNFVKDSNIEDGQSVDLSILPIGLKFKNLNLNNIDNWIQSVADHSLDFNMVKDTNDWQVEKIPYEKVGLVCTHNEVDCRCGTTGVQIYNRLQELVEENHLNYKVYQCSHIGGHKYAGNLVSYPDGDWYGLLNSSNIDKFFKLWTTGQLDVKHWRGNHNLSEEDQLKYINQYQ